MIKFKYLILVLLLSCLSLNASSISGIVKNKDNNEMIKSVSVLLKNTNSKTITDKNGQFQFNNLKSGSYTIEVVSSLFQKYSKEVSLNENQDLNVEILVDIASFQFHEVTVFGATKKTEKITESPSAINALIPADITKSSRNGQIASALIGTTGVDILQNGTSDFIVNTRGFNNGLNRRILVLQDGRDVAMPLLGAVEWNSFSIPLEDFSSIELVRGPSASLYGANAFNGVLNLKSYSPKEVIGTKISLLGGDYETYRGDIRHAGAYDDFSYKISFGLSHSLNYSNRRDSIQFLEYPGLAIEKKVLTDAERQTKSIYGNLRFDYDLDKESKIISEFGYSKSGNESYVFGLGRTLVKDVEKPYARLAYNSKNFNIQANYMQRSVSDSMWLMVPAFPLLDNDKDFMIDAQYNYDILSNLNVIAGISHQIQLIRTSGTSIPNDVDANFTGIYGQLQFDMNKYIKLVGSARADISNIHESQFSPRLALVLTPFSNNHQFRFTAGRSFQRPNYSEYYRNTPDAPAFSSPGKLVDFASLEKSIADSISKLSGKSSPILNLGIKAANSKALGNPNLKVEKNIGFEFGYKGILSNSFFVTTDVYYNIMNDFITNFLPGVNPNYAPWTPNLPDSLKSYADLVKNMVYSKLSPRDKLRLTYVNGIPTFVVSNTNVGEVRQYGLDLGINYYLTDYLLFGLNYSYYNYEVTESSISQPIYANTSPSKFNFKATYNYQNIFDINLSYSYTQEYNWLAGTYLGKVPSYQLVNLNAGVNITNSLNLGINIFNLLNEHHFEVFGGTYLPRYTTVKLSYEL
jgi:outer membrane receptor protein involved in Fe transport